MDTYKVEMNVNGESKTWTGPAFSMQGAINKFGRHHDIKKGDVVKNISVETI